jgi:hydroxymethylbilane synthase
VTAPPPGARPSDGARAGDPARPARVRIATRASALALWQARWIEAKLRAAGAEVELVEIETQGDKDGRPFAEIAGVGFFTKAVQEAVLDGRADVAVHSYKDLPSAPAPGLEVAAVPERADPRDVLVVRPEAFDEDAAPLPLRAGTVVGTGAARRRAQLAALRPDIATADLRGNVPTRVEKLRGGGYGAIVLAAAGLNRLEADLDGLEAVVLDPATFVPAPAQGALALEIRRGDDGLASLLTELHDVRGHRAVAAERGLMAMIQGGCQLALGAHARRTNGTLTLHAWYEGRGATVQHPSSEGAAMLAYDALGRPDPHEEAPA